MSASGYLESLLNNLPLELRPPMVNFARYAFKTLQLGPPPDATGVNPSQNFAAAIVRFTTPAVANTEKAVEHRLDRVPRFLMPCLSLDAVNATIPVLTVTRAADKSFFYVKSPSTSTECLVYVE